MICVTAFNHSSLSRGEVEAICETLSHQANRHIAPAWMRSAVSIGSRAPYQNRWELIFLESSDREGALGEHEEAEDGGVVMKVFVKDCEAAGIAPSVCASHELAEAMVDPHVRNAEFDGRSKFWATEIGDPAQASTYEIGGIKVQDFVTPFWFDPHPPPGVKFDHTGKITRPFQVPKGGYAQFLDLAKPSAGWQEIGMELGVVHTRPARRRNSLRKDSA